MRNGIAAVFGFSALVCCSSAPSPPSGSSGSSGSSGQTLDSADAGVDAAPEAAAPACLAPGQSCTSDVNGCCNGSTCVFDTKNPSVSVCAATCLNDSQCTSGCCRVIVGGSEAVCAPESYCATACVSPGGGSCQSAPCCAGSVCVSSTVTGVSCAAECTTGANCVSGCCAPLNNTGQMVCSPANFCP